MEVPVDLDAILLALLVIISIRDEIDQFVEAHVRERSSPSQLYVDIQRFDGVGTEKVRRLQKFQIRQAIADVFPKLNFYLKIIYDLP